jgi:type I restriction enzyme S subunit
VTRIPVAPWLEESRWPIALIRLVARLGTGHTPSRSVPAYWEDCTVPWITLADVWQLRNGTTDVVTETKEKVSALGLANSAAVKHPAGTVILSRTASVGFSAIMGADMATSQDFATWTCGPKLDARYLLHALRAMAPDLKRISMGSTHKTIYMPDIEQLRVPLPPVEEQRRIADFLDAETTRIDRMVELRKLQQQTLAGRYREVVRDAFAGLSSGSPTRLKYLLKARPRYGVLVPHFVGDGVKFIRVNDLPDLAGRAQGLAMIPMELSKQYPTTIVREGDVLVSVVGTLGRAAVVPASLRGANVNRAIAVLRPRPEVEQELLTAWIESEEFESQALLATGNDSAQRTLGMEDLANFRLAWPTDPSERVSLAVEISQSQAAVRDVSARVARQQEVLVERRQALITAAVTGQIDVSTASGRGIGE